MKFFKNNFVVKFILALFLISILIGFLLYMAYKPDLSSYINDFKELLSTTKQNTFLFNIGIISLVFVLSLSIIGMPIVYFYVFYEGVCTGFTAALFLTLFGFKGITFYAIFIILSKLVYILLLLYFLAMCTRFDLKIIQNLIHKSKDDLYKNLTNHFYRYIIIFIVLILNSTFIYFFSNKILMKFINLIS